MILGLVALYNTTPLRISLLHANLSDLKLRICTSSVHLSGHSPLHDGLGADRRIAKRRLKPRFLKSLNVWAESFALPDLAQIRHDNKQEPNADRLSTTLKAEAMEVAHTTGVWFVSFGFSEAVAHFR